MNSGKHEVVMPLVKMILDLDTGITKVKLATLTSRLQEKG